MLYIPTLISVLEVLLVTVPVLLTVVYVTVAERKTITNLKLFFSNPPKPYAFVSLPLQSSLSPKSTKVKSFYLGRHLHKAYPVIIGAKGNILFTQKGRKIFDACSGAAVSCLGYKNPKVILAITKQIKTGVPYLASTF